MLVLTGLLTMGLPLIAGLSLAMVVGVILLVGGMDN